MPNSYENMHTFYGHGQRLPDRYGSNFCADCPFTFMAKRFDCSEQALMYCKALEHGDKVSARAILQAKTPAQAKQLGRRVTPFNEERWNKVRGTIMYMILKEKFGQNPDARRWLMATHPAMLVEASPKDAIWGAGVAKKDIMNGQAFPGDNLLGRVLTTLRFMWHAENVKEQTMRDF